MISLRLLSVLTVIVSTLTEFCERRAPNTNNSLSIQDCQTFHQIYLNIGTPSMAYPFLVDTGSLMTWVPTVGCNCGLGIDSMVSATSRITRKSHNITVRFILFSMLMGTLSLALKALNTLLFQILI